jgi:MarR-like DNA-binding transcriptional regulator SgrR of sgrS sRNA
MIGLLGVVSPGHAGRLPRYGGTLRITVATLPASLDPLKLGGDDGAVLAACLYEGLTRRDSAGVAPALARTWTHDDEAQRWRFELRSDALFHDGTRCDAPAVARALERLADPRQSPYAWLLSDLTGWDEFAAGRTAHVEGIDVLDATEIELDFAARASDVPARLALPVAAIARRRGNDWLGTGPFEVTAAPAEVLRLIASRNHALGRPYLDRVEFAAGTDTAAASDAGTLPVTRVRPTETQLAGTIRRRSAASRLGFLLLNPQGQVLATDASRHRLAQSFDRKVFVRVVLEGDGEATEDLVPVDVRRIGTRIGSSADDLETTPGQHARIVVSQAEPVLRALGERLQVHLYALGIPAAVEALPAAGLARELAQGHYDIAVLGWTPPQSTGERLMPVTALQYFASSVLQPTLGAAMPDAWAPARLAAAKEPAAVLLRGDLCIPLVFFHDLWQTPGEVLHLEPTPAGAGLDLRDTHLEPRWP